MSSVHTPPFGTHQYLGRDQILKSHHSVRQGCKKARHSLLQWVTEWLNEQHVDHFHGITMNDEWHARGFQSMRYNCWNFKLLKSLNLEMVLLRLVDRFDSPCGCEISQLLNFKWERERDRHARRKRRARNFKERARFCLPDSKYNLLQVWPLFSRLSQI